MKISSELALPLALAAAAPSATLAFSHHRQPSSSFSASLSKLRLEEETCSTNDVTMGRRSAMISAASLLGGAAALLSPNAAIAGETRQGIELTPFNSLTFQYRNPSNGGLDASSLNEPSIPYADFLEKLTAGDVEFVEFLAPDGDVCYATLKASGDGGAKSRIRVGEGFPTEDHEGWSSPAFAIKSVKKSNVPYKFVVPGLDAYKYM